MQKIFIPNVMSILNPFELYEKAQKSGINLAVLCDHANMPKSTFYRWLNGSNGATLTSLEKLNKSLEELLKKAKSNDD